MSLRPVSRVRQGPAPAATEVTAVRPGRDRPRRQRSEVSKPVSTLPSCAAGVPLFGVLPAQALAELATSLRHQRFGRDEVIARHGDPVEHLIVVASGRARLVHTTASGREQTVRLLEPGDFTGELGLFVPALQEGHLVALAETTVCLVPRQAVQSLLARHPEVSQRLVESLVQRLAETEQLLVDISLRDVGSRLAATLWRLGERQAPGAPPATTSPPAATVTIPFSWAQLAVRLGTTPESLSRALRTLARQGLIEHRGSSREVALLDLERLAEIAQL